MKFGARILKTGIAIVLSLLVADLLGLPSPVFAPIAAIFAIQPTIYRSYLTIIEQIQGNIIGAIIAVISVLALGNHPIIVGLAAIILIAINLKLKLENTISLSVVTMIVIMLSPSDSFIEFALIRFGTIMLGVFSAFLVNLVFMPPKYENKLYWKISFVTEEISKWIRINTRHATEYSLLKKDIKKLKEEIREMEQLYLKYKEERAYFRRKWHVKARKLVIYRQMVATSKRALDVLKRLHRFENEMSLLPENVQLEIQQQLDFLVEQHEQILLKFIGKIKPKLLVEDDITKENRKELFTLFIAQQKELNFEHEATFFHIMQIVSAIIEYNDYLEHLDVLVTSFVTHHKKDNKVSMDDFAQE